MKTLTPQDPQGLLVDSLERRALAFCLAARLTSWPDDEALTDARTLAASLDEGDHVERALAALARTSRRAELEPEYVALFETGQSRCPIRETEYGGMAPGSELADLAGFYAAFGMERATGDAAWHMGDHLAIELEFYGTLLARQAALTERGDSRGEEVVRDARRQFLADHLGRLAAAVSGQPNVRQSARYGPLLASTAELVELECGSLGATPAPLDFVPGSPA